ncbi:MAG: hypothetical protein EPO21_11665 [Chloroflexota bacterium]|nr:MAG: hypothetical protein EPO21_11665 [Chloroflexota bacterium]
MAKQRHPEAQASRLRMNESQTDSVFETESVWRTRKPPRSALSKPIVLQPRKDYIDQVLWQQVDLQADGQRFVLKDQLSSDWPACRYR